MNTNNSISPRYVNVFLGALVALFLFPGYAFAVSAFPGIQVIQQPNGTAIQVQQFGDEWSNGIRTLDGYTILKDSATGVWKYAEQNGSGGLRASALVAGSDVPTNIPKKLRTAPVAQPSTGPGPVTSLTGTSPILVIFTDFTPSTRVGSTAASLSAKFFGATNSVKSYYQEVSYGAFSMSPAAESDTALGGSVNDGVVSVTLNYAHPNTGGTIDSRNQQITRDALIAADSKVNFSSFDTNSDGVIGVNELHVVVVVAGYEAAYDLAHSCGASVWGHRWGLFGSVAAPTLDGKRVGDGYMQFGESHCSTSSLPAHEATIGIMVHELGHDIGLPDLYDTDGTSEGIGSWSVMAGGNWNGVTFAGDSPAHFDPWSKFFEGWVAPTLVTSSLSNESITQSATTPDVYQFLSGTPTSGEYFLLENRQKVNYDSALPGAGLLLWHIDAARSGNTAECYPGGPSCASSHYQVAVVQADNLYELEKNIDRGDAGDPYPGTTGKTAFDAASSPNSNLYSGAASGVSVTAMSASGSTMTATLSGSGGGGSDTTPPSAPTNLTGTPSGTQVALTWTASTDNVGVTGYKVYRGGVEIASVTGTSYTNTGLTAGTTYQYTVKAFDAAGNLSATSNTASVTIAGGNDTTAPSKPTNLVAISGVGVTLNWTASTDNVGVVGYQIFRSAVQIATSPTNSFVDTTGVLNQSYNYKVRAYDAAGNVSAFSNIVSGKSTSTGGGDAIAPSAPTNLAGVPTSTQVALTWTASTDNVGVAGYRVYRNGTQVGTPTGLSYTDTGLTASTLYQYTVKAIDAAGNLSATSNTATVTTLAGSDTTPPSAPTNLAGTPTATQVSLTWNASTDNVGVVGYRVYRAGQLIGSPTVTSFVDSSVGSAGTTWEYEVTAVDAAGNVSSFSNTATITVPSGSDTTPPSAPTNLTGTPSGTQVALTWTASTDNVGVTGYKVYRGGVEIASVTGTSYTNTGLTAGTTYQYTVKAFDAAGNLSAASNTATVTVPTGGGSDTIAPTVPTNLNATNGSNMVTLNWTASTDNVGVAGYQIFRANVQIATSPTTTFVDTTGAVGQRYTYQVRAYDAAGNVSALSSGASGRALP